MPVPGKGHNNPPSSFDELLDEAARRYAFAAAGPTLLRELILNDIGPELAAVMDRVIKAMFGPPCDPEEAGALAVHLAHLLKKPDEAERVRRRQLQRKRQSTPEYRAARRERERRNRAAKFYEARYPFGFNLGPR